MEKTRGRIKIKTSAADKAVSIVTYVVVITLCLLILLPCLNVLALSFNDGRDAARGGVYFWPRVFTLENYAEVFQDGSLVNAYKITIARTAVGTLMSLIVTSFAAFALNQTELPGRKIITFLITFTMLFGGGTIPTYIQYNDLGMLDTFWVLVIPSLVSVTYLIMMRSFFDLSLIHIFLTPTFIIEPLFRDIRCRTTILPRICYIFPINCFFDVDPSTNLQRFRICYRGIHGSISPFLSFPDG